MMRRKKQDESTGPPSFLVAAERVTSEAAAVALRDLVWATQNRDIKNIDISIYPSLRRANVTFEVHWEDPEEE